MSDSEHLDAIVIGGNIRGLVTAYVLSSLGYKALLVDKAKTVGGADGSFKAADGSVFEFGMHVLDFMRSELATRLFSRVVDGAVNRIKLRRGIVLRNELMPYSPLPAEMPPSLAALLAKDPLHDDLGDRPPSRENLAAIYGEGFSDLIFDEVLPSFPSESRHLDFGVAEEQLMANIYPWFFPRAERATKSGDESRAFHDLLRSGVDQYILYPKRGGFGAFSAGFVDKLDPMRVEVLLGADDLEIQVVPNSHTIRKLNANGREFTADHYFWGASWPQLCALLEIPCQNTATDRILIGSFRLNRPAITDYHEILVGDPNHNINRIYFPAMFRQTDDPLVQVEFAIPLAAEFPVEADFWQASWVKSLQELGFLDAQHAVELFDFKTRAMHFNAFGMEGEPLVDADAGLLRADSNVYPPIPSMANLNLNSHVPRTVAYVTDVLSRSLAE